MGRARRAGAAAGGRAARMSTIEVRRPARTGRAGSADSGPDDSGSDESGRDDSGSDESGRDDFGRIDSGRDRSQRSGPDSSQPSGPDPSQPSGPDPRSAPGPSRLDASRSGESGPDGSRPDEVEPIGPGPIARGAADDAPRAIELVAPPRQGESTAMAGSMGMILVPAASGAGAVLLAVTHQDRPLMAVAGLLVLAASIASAS